MRYFLLFLLLFSTASNGSQSARPCTKAWVFFDLGNTIVDTRTYNYEKIFYIPGALEYLNELKHKGYKLGLIINIPEEWGQTYSKKIKALKDFIQASWTDPQPMTWELFNAGIFVPSKDIYRKPHPYLFKKVVRRAARRGCKVIYQGEIKEELEIAKQAGMVTHQVGTRPHFFMPLD